MITFLNVLQITIQYFKPKDEKVERIELKNFVGNDTTDNPPSLSQKVISQMSVDSHTTDTSSSLGEEVVSQMSVDPHTTISSNRTNGIKVKKSLISKIASFIKNLFLSLFSTISSWFFKPPEKKERVTKSEDPNNNSAQTNVKTVE